jgi:hypothetical protein
LIVTSLFINSGPGETVRAASAKEQFEEVHDFAP